MFFKVECVAGIVRSALAGLSVLNIGVNEFRSIALSGNDVVRLGMGGGAR